MNRYARLGFALALLPVAACSQKPADPVASAPPPAPALSAADQSFIQAAGASDQFEVQSSQLAGDHARRPAVKDFATQMIQAHTQTTQQLMQIVQGKGMTPPAPQLTDDQQKMLSTLGNEKMAKFDRDYVQDQIAGHTAAVSVFQQEIDGGQDADVKAFAQQTLPVIKQHLAEAQKLSGMRAPHMAMHHHKGAAATGDNGATPGSDMPAPAAQ